MRNVLIVCPHFPPTNAPDMHRVRMSAPLFGDFGWNPIVLAIEPGKTNFPVEADLLLTIGNNIEVHRTSALPVSLTRRTGFSDVGLRAFVSAYSSGSKILRSRNISLVYFSTTVFNLLPLGRLWKGRFGTPYIVDMQDEWFTAYYDSKPESMKPPRYGTARLLNRHLEAWTMREVHGIVSVTDAYIATLQRRYPWLKSDRCRTIPFGASMRDFEIASSRCPRPRLSRGEGYVHGVYAGVLGRNMEKACRIICSALRDGLRRTPELFSKVRLHFFGTDYNSVAPKQTIKPIADALGVGEYIEEQPERLPYLETLSLLKEADFVLVPGTDDPTYTASKIYSYIMAEKPMVSLFHQDSSVVSVIRKTRAGDVVAFSADDSEAETAEVLSIRWASLLGLLPFRPNIDWDAFRTYSATEMTRRQCELFDTIARPQATTVVLR